MNGQIILKYFFETINIFFVLCETVIMKIPKTLLPKESSINKGLMIFTMDVQIQSL